ncbi:MULTISPECIES: F420H2 dehydrogenase subunit FpoD [unclassified Methanosarcina]|uniref:F420H2 dehydrogenase subunit FpoD n=1 Tax=unclassified Methanosarcina TaxID=2644672 RepID=UPI0006157E12|nr:MULTISPECIES: F420H2 dehydrogenase subunit FpoD [unclassified Methanosarcina]AKB20025.1 NADH-quinone oxidoreductase subunit C/D [Methanosarcina sp. WWM596]AKB22180.1 NADH-quinone oxidoreductase subunit C/D [Methanosarcina sp. WH1]
MEEMLESNEMIVHLGPQHPMQPGPFRLNLRLKGETVMDAEVELGYIHKGIEKILENKTYLQGITIVDRICYLVALTNEECFVGCVEKLLGIEPPARSQYIRVILEELSRLQSHLLGMGEFGEFIGFVSMFMYTIKEREDILTLIDMVTGARVTHSYLKFGGVRDDLPAGFKEKALPVLNNLKKVISDYEEMFQSDRIYRERTEGVGILTADVAKSLGVSGPALRATGVPFDIRKNEPYLVYEDLDFKVCTETAGDCAARVRVRLNEMRESIYILEQCLDQIPNGPLFPEGTPYGRRTPVMRVPAGEVFHRVEDPRGEMGMYMISDGTDKPYRVKVRGPYFPTLQALPPLIIGTTVADVAAISGSMDGCTSEADR